MNIKTLNKKTNPYKEGYTLIAYVPKELIPTILKSMPKKKRDGNVVIVPPFKGSFPSLWAVNSYGLKKYVNMHESKYRRLLNKKVRNLK